MDPQLERALLQVDRTVDDARRAAGNELVRTFRYLLSTRRLGRHKLSIDQYPGVVCLHVNGLPWYQGHRDRRPAFTIFKLLDDIDEAIEKCDPAVIKTVTGVIL